MGIFSLIAVDLVNVRVVAVVVGTHVCGGFIMVVLLDHTFVRAHAIVNALTLVRCIAPVGVRVIVT
eukprot:14042930-Alexandrium_andersonii.AAC.1